MVFIIVDKITFLKLKDNSIRYGPDIICSLKVSAYCELSIINIRIKLFFSQYYAVLFYNTIFVVLTRHGSIPKIIKKLDRMSFIFVSSKTFVNFSENHPKKRICFGTVNKYSNQFILCILLIVLHNIPRLVRKILFCKGVCL